MAEIGRGELRSPAQIALDGAGNVWVADRGNDRVRAFAPDGTLLGVASASAAWAPGQFVEPAGSPSTATGS